MFEIKYKTVNSIRMLSKSSFGWTKELNSDWSADHEATGKGVTLPREELILLKEIPTKVEL